MQNDRLRMTAYKLYYKTEVLKSGMAKQDAVKHLMESIKPYKTYYESPGVLSQEAIEYEAKNELLQEFANKN